MFKRLSLVSSLALASALMWGQGVPNALAQEKATAQMVPTSGWSVARIDANVSAPENYCALSRQYDQNIVLTLGRNETEEYSLAIDFQTAKLNVEKAYSVTLQPGPGQIRAYEMMPASHRAMVIRLGYDDSFFNALEASNVLKAEIDATNYQFEMSDFSSGRSDLDNCLAGLKGKSNKSTKLAKSFNAEKVTDAPPMAEKPKGQKIEPPKMAEVIKTPASEEIKTEASRPQKPIQISRVETKQIDNPVASNERGIEFAAEEVKVPEPVTVRAPEKKLVVERIASKQVAPPPQPSAAPVTKLSNIRSNNDALIPESLKNNRANKEVSRRVQTAPTSPPQNTGQSTLQKQQREALEQLKAENERLNKALRVEMEKPSQPAPERSGEVAALQSQINQLQAELAKEKTTPDPIDEKLKADVEKLRAENEQLKLSMQAQARAKEQQISKIPDKTQELKEMSQEIEATSKSARVDPEVMRQLENLKAENTRLSAALQGQEQKLSSFDAKSPQAEKELAAIRNQLQQIQEENKRLYEQAQKNRGFVDTAVSETSNQALQKMREYEKKLEAARNDNLALSKEIEELRRMKEDGRLGAVAGDWDLEKATKRYNEAEREIKRLGMLLEQQRLVHRQEKQELEQMLFDPAVTENEQRRRLTELELQLAAAERELQAAGRAMPQRTMVPRSPIEERITLGMTPDPIVAQQRESLEIQRLNNKVARQNQQLQAYNRQLANTERMAAMPSPEVRAQPLTRPSRPAPVTAPAPSIMTPKRPAPTMVEPPPVQPEPVKEKPASSGFGQNQLQQILSRAGLSLRGAITKQGSGQYRWSSGDLVGQAQIIPMAQAGNVSQFAQSYIAKAKQSCGGDFASLPSPSAVQQGQAFEIACISPSRSTSSSVIFTQKGNDLVAISHESTAENMDMAMDARDRIAASL